MNQTTIDTYNKAAAAYARKFNALSRAQNIEHAFSFVEKDNPRVVELGCGNGRDAVDIVTFTNDYIGIDASKAMIALARDIVPSAEFMTAEIETFVLPGGVDIVFAFASLLHLDKKTVADVMQKTHSALAADGIVYISLKKGTYHRETKVDEYGSRVFYFYSKTDINDIAGDNYQIVYYDEQNLRGVDWLIAVLQKS